MAQPHHPGWPSPPTAGRAAGESLPELGALAILSDIDPMKSLPRNRNGIDVESDVYKMLQDYEKPISEPKQSGSFRYLQGMLEASENVLQGKTPLSVSFQGPHTPIIITTPGLAEKLMRNTGPSWTFRSFETSKSKDKSAASQSPRQEEANGK
ncbi:hypothetical protein DV515_00006956 [Chloebia gouldiae]|uniref:PDZ and LIM domain-containing protein n=1 Tax=Chloebia gouldiae TaxID=44316 RepID=A0A3L8SJC2_CHLGU|nr:hypothetical protein DV515_00006956 [Chloebia gouldiae]